ncbi:MAG: guanylate kinase [Bacteroidota bacterium]
MRHSLHKSVIFAGPSGSGKTTIAQHLLKENPELSFSISACTRAKRPQEVHGKDYYFLSIDEFKREITQKSFIEWEEVYDGHYYGTLKREVDSIWQSGKAAVFDMDVQGALRLKSHFQERALAVYIQVPSMQLLTERLKKRKTESEEGLGLRMGKAAYEASLAEKFDTILVNEQLQETLETAQKLLDDFLSTPSVPKQDRLSGEIESRVN